MTAEKLTIPVGIVRGWKKNISTIQHTINCNNCKKENTALTLCTYKYNITYMIYL